MNDINMNTVVASIRDIGTLVLILQYGSERCYIREIKAGGKEYGIQTDRLRAV